MLFELKTTCKDCPFRTDIKFYLRPDRVREITDAIFLGGTFTCHKTTHHNSKKKVEEQHCAGAMIMLEKQNKPNQLMRIMERIGYYDHRKLSMDAPVFDTPEEMIAQREKICPR